MQVDDKLAKEKLISELLRVFGDCFTEKVLQLIRNTDLTDCQPQQQNEYMSVTQAGNNPSATPSGTPITDAAEMDAFTLDIPGQATTDRMVRSLLARVLERELVAARDALRPFAEYGRQVLELDGDGSTNPDEREVFTRLTYGDFRRALRTTEGKARESAGHAGSGINNGVVAPDQGSVRNATDMREALQFYADPKNYDEDGVVGKETVESGITKKVIDRGNVARKAL